MEANKLLEIRALDKHLPNPNIQKFPYTLGIIAYLGTDWGLVLPISICISAYFYSKAPKKNRKIQVEMAKYLQISTTSIPHKRAVHFFLLWIKGCTHCTSDIRLQLS